METFEGRRVEGRFALSDSRDGSGQSAWPLSLAARPLAHNHLRRLKPAPRYLPCAPLKRRLSEIPNWALPGTRLGSPTTRSLSRVRQLERTRWHVVEGP
jgi:hypothetical protein